MLITLNEIHCITMKGVKATSIPNNQGAISLPSPVQGPLFLPSLILCPSPSPSFPSASPFFPPLHPRPDAKRPSFNQLRALGNVVSSHIHVVPQLTSCWCILREKNSFDSNCYMDFCIQKIRHLHPSQNSQYILS